MLKHIIIGIIAIYFIYVIYKKVKNIKNGKFCNCSCDNCSIKGTCTNSKED